MHVQRIMCPVDFSQSSIFALDDAASLADQLGAQLLILHVDNRPAPELDGRSGPVVQTGAWRRHVEAARPAAGSHRVEFELHVAHGNPTDEIPRFALAHEVDLVVMAHHTAQERVQCRTQGVCATASRECGCPVMTVRHVPSRPSWVRVDGDGWSPA
jgi:nucleotide-binding universal stress UspA family protein